MCQCSSTSDCYKASLQYKIDKATGKTSPGESKLQWQNSSGATASAPSSAKSPNLGTNFDADG